MAEDAIIFVSKRFQRIAFAVLCLMAGQLILAACQPEVVPMAASVSLGG